MIRGLYIAASAAISENKRIDVISNNIANVNTSGFKKDTMVTESFPEILMKRIGATDYRDIIAKAPLTSKIGYIGKMNNGVRVDEVFTNFEQGPISTSGNPLDLALQGKGFFSVETPTGEKYTRSGEFTLDSEGYITTKEGYKVLGQNGPMQVNGKNIIINEDGQVFSDGNEIDTLKLVDFNDDTLLKKQGDALYIDASGDAGNMKASEGLVLQGSFEASNVNSVKSMVEMITMLRSYEANQKVIKTHDEMLGKSVNEIGRL
ncbi:MAG: flagellar basal-body rod protein FlgF [Clostridia bacterium]|nr:flagellar basal-body rod protein FlgF [Clostridia bacterium]